MLIDSHCHIPHKSYGIPSEQVLEEAKQEGVEKVITIGTSLSESKKSLEFAAKHENVYCTIGIYPHEDKSKSVSELYEGLAELLKAHRNKIVGIGECGLDITNWDGGRNVEDQLEVFKMQLGFAIDHDLPVVIHNRNGEELILDTLKKYTAHKKRLRGVAHCFTQNWDFAQKMLEHNYYISFSGIVTYPSAAKELLEVVEKVPANRYLVETDSPYLAPQEHRGKTNFPKYVKIVAEKVADIRKITFDQASKESYKNTVNLFLHS